MNSYEQRQEAKRERLQARASRLRAAATNLHARARKMGECIPFGQPILIGHHSEGRDRRYRARITRTYRTSWELQDKAEAAEARANRIGKGGISSDDPEALKKLLAKLEGLQNNHELMKAANRIIKTKSNDHAKVAALVSLGYGEEHAQRLLLPDFLGRVGFPAYSLQNSLGQQQQVKKRILALQRKNERAEALAKANPEGEAAREERTEKYTFREDLEENRYMFIFSGKPDADTRAILKKNAFKWSPTRGAWVRQISSSGRYAVECVKEALSA